MTAERPRSNKAVAKTEGQILMYDGKVARTYYSSSSGGATEAVQDAWPGSAPIPYLRSVSDPWDTYSPNHDWGPYTYSADQLAARLGLAGAVESARIQRDTSLRADSVGSASPPARAVSLSGAAVARTLGSAVDRGSRSVSCSSRRAPRASSTEAPSRVVARALEGEGRRAPAAEPETESGGHCATSSGRSVLSLEPRASTAFRLRVAGRERRGREPSPSGRGSTSSRSGRACSAARCCRALPVP